MDKKVYCINCGNFCGFQVRHESKEHPVSYGCSIIKENKDTPHFPVEELSWCSDKNSNNDCKDWTQGYRTEFKYKKFLGIPVVRETVLVPIEVNTRIERN